MRSFASIVSIFLTVMVLRADCPTPIECGPGVCVWPSNVGVSYAFPSSNPPPCWAAQSIAGLGIDGDINSAFNRWGYANQNQNSSNVSFYRSSPPAAFEVVAWQVVDYSSCGVSVPAQTTQSIDAYTGYTIGGYTYFYLGSRTSLGYANYDPNANNYHAAIQKLMAHEIGHTMGLDNQPEDTSNPNCYGQTAGQSVMNDYCGTNDSANNMPDPTMLGIPSCDNQSVY